MALEDRQRPDVRAEREERDANHRQRFGGTPLHECEAQLHDGGHGEGKLRVTWAPARLTIATLIAKATAKIGVRCPEVPRTTW